MSQYDELDKLIIKAIGDLGNPLYDKACSTESTRIASETGREDFRVLDGRLQALRKTGKIRHMTKTESNGKGGWRLASESQKGDA